MSSASNVHVAVPSCGKCGSVSIYTYASRRIFKCKDCGSQFSATSGTIFASRKMAIRDVLAAIAIFANGAKGISALQLSRDLDCQYRTAYVLAHKMRESMVSETEGLTLSGTVEIDGAYFGGHVKPANFKEQRIDRRLSENQTGKRRCVVVMRERGGRTITRVGKSELEAVPTILKRVAPAPSFMPMRRPLGMGCTRIMKCAGSITAFAIRTAWPAPTARKAFSVACVGPNSAPITASGRPISPPMPVKWSGAKITAAKATARSLLGLRS